MRRYGLIGRNIEYSLSPRIHGLIFEYLGINDCTYEIIDIEREELLKNFKELAKEYDGFNVTIPYKNDILALVDKNYSEISAANTIVSKAGETRAYNTDILGFMLALAKFSKNSEYSNSSDNNILSIIRQEMAKGRDSYDGNDSIRHDKTGNKDAQSKLSIIRQEMAKDKDNYERNDKFRHVEDGEAAIYNGNDIVKQEGSKSRDNNERNDSIRNVIALEAEGIREHFGRVLVLGAGGAAEAAVFALQAFSICPSVKSRGGAKLRALLRCYKASSFSSELSPNTIINASGKSPSSDGILEGIELKDLRLFYDMSYNKRGEREFFSEFNGGNIKYEDGLDMLIFQAIFASELLYNVKLKDPLELFSFIKERLSVPH